MPNLDTHKSQNVIRLRKFEGNAEQLLRDVAEHRPDEVALIEIKDGNYNVWYTTESKSQLIGMLEMVQWDLMAGEDV